MHPMLMIALADEVERERSGERRQIRRRSLAAGRERGLRRQSRGEDRAGRLLGSRGRRLRFS